MMILCVIIVQERHNTWAAMRVIGRPGLAAALCSTAATICYINALCHTSVADVAVPFAVAPFIIAGLGLGVKEMWTTLAASVVAMIVVIVVVGALTDGHLLGDVLGVWHGALHGNYDVDYSPASRDADVAGGMHVGAAVPNSGLATRLPFRYRRD
jgi:drug/metabolite transporter (DMT)-like permease